MNNQKHKIMLQLLQEIHDHYEIKEQRILPHPDAPGHLHSKPGHWDADGSPCEWCATWNRLKEFISQTSKLTDFEQVAAFRLPVSVKFLGAIMDELTREYGKSLTMRQVGNSLIIKQHNAQGDSLPPQEKNHGH